MSEHYERTGKVVKSLADVPHGAYAVGLYQRTDEPLPVHVGYGVLVRVPAPAEQPPAEEKRTRYFRWKGPRRQIVAFLSFGPDGDWFHNCDGSKGRTRWTVGEMVSRIGSDHIEEISHEEANALLSPSPDQSRIRELETRVEQLQRELADKQQSLADALAECCKLKEELRVLRKFVDDVGEATHQRKLAFGWAGEREA